MGRISRAMRAPVMAGLVMGAAACASLQPHPVALVTAPSSCQDFTASLYFDRDSDSLTREARAVLRGAKAQAGHCVVEGVEVLGLADAVGAQDANLILSRKRAHAVSHALTELGFPDAKISAVAMGEAGSLTPDGVAPLHRRADVTFHLKPPA